MAVSNSHPSRVILIGRPGSTQEQVAAALNNDPGFLFVDLVPRLDSLARDVTSSEAEIILIDHEVTQDRTFDVINDLALQFPHRVVIAILPGHDPSLIQQTMLAGARAFLLQPFTQINLISTLQRVRTLEDARVRQASPNGVPEEELSRALRAVTVFSPKGGVGCTTIAINLAYAYREQTSKRVLLMDGKFYFSHLDVILNIRTKNSIADLIPHANNLDDNLVKDVVYPHASGVDVLLGPDSIQFAQGIRPDDLFSVYRGLQRNYDFIVIDGGSQLTENTVTLMDATDRILLVTTPDLAALHDVSNFIQLSHSLAFPQEKMLLIMNRNKITGGITAKDVEASIRQRVFADIPDDGPNALRSINRGVPYIHQYPRKSVSAGVKNLAEKLLHLNETQSADETTRVGDNLSRVPARP